MRARNDSAERAKVDPDEMRRTELQAYLKLLKDRKPELQRRFRVKSLGIFGSYIRGEQKKSSDLDILVEFSETPSLFEFIRLKIYLRDLLNVNVDLVMKSALKPNIGKSILREVLPI